MARGPEAGARGTARTDRAPVRIALLGSTGSVGRQTVDVIETLGRDVFEVVALAAGRDAATLSEQVARLRPRVVSLADPVAAGSLDMPVGTSTAEGPDALLVLLMTLAAVTTLRGIEDGRRRWVVATGALVGFGFLTKQLQVLLVVPPFAAAHLWAAPGRWLRRLGDLLVAGATMIVTAGWWIALVELCEEARASSFGRWILGADEGAAVGWAVRPDDLEAVAARHGLSIDRGSRTGPSGQLVEWRMAGVRQAAERPWLPFFIGWGDRALFPGAAARGRAAPRRRAPRRRDSRRRRPARPRARRWPHRRECARWRARPLAGDRPRRLGAT